MGATVLPRMRVFVAKRARNAVLVCAPNASNISTPTRSTEFPGRLAEHTVPMRTLSPSHSPLAPVRMRPGPPSASATPGGHYDDDDDEVPRNSHARSVPSFDALMTLRESQ